MIKKDVFLKFNDGYVKFMKLILLKDGSIKIALIGDLAEWTIHKNRVHCKKLQQEKWVESEEEKHRKYCDINCADYFNTKGILGIFMQLFVNGFTISSHVVPKKEDSVLIINQNSKNRICLYISYCSENPGKMAVEHMNRNNISPFILVKMDFKFIMVGIKKNI